MFAYKIKFSTSFNVLAREVIINFHIILENTKRVLKNINLPGI